MPTVVALGNLALNAGLDAAFYRFGVWGIPLSTSVVNIAGTAALLYLLRVRGKSDEAPSEDRRRSLLLAGLFVIMALAANAAYAGVWFSEIHYRTHILSRIWASVSSSHSCSSRATRA